MSGLIGSGFTPHAITINTGEVIYTIELLLAKNIIEGLGLLVVALVCKAFGNLNI